jgi:N6-L-threonylcarbamoyladenine synthase
MRILGIETSCDDTGVAIVDHRPRVLAELLHSQTAMHTRYGGVVPELASRDHIARLAPMVDQCCAAAGVGLRDLDGVAWTQGPGLAGALLVGASLGPALALGLGIPGLGIHHLEGHLLAPLLDEKPPAFPFLALICSGGHTQMMEVTGLGAYTLLGDTLDDAAGEAFDKSAKMMGLGYPGGPAIAQLACHGDATRFVLPRPLLHSNDLDFSFSGFKTAVLTLLKKLGADPHNPVSTEALATRDRNDLAAGIQAAICEVLCAKALAAVRRTGLRRLVIAGGVSANALLRNTLAAQCAKAGVQLHCPPLRLCTDNGAMIALAGLLRMREGETPRGRELAAQACRVRPRWALESLRPPSTGS